MTVTFPRPDIDEEVLEESDDDLEFVDPDAVPLYFPSED